MIDVMHVNAKSFNNFFVIATCISEVLLSFIDTTLEALLASLATWIINCTKLDISCR